MRNSIGRFLSSSKIGSIMPAPYSVTQLATALESYRFWIANGCDHMHACALLGNEDGETSFLWTAVGDAKTGGAHGVFQWHAARADDIQHGCGIDVRTAGHADQLKAAHWEMSDPRAPKLYRAVYAKFLKAASLWGAVTVLVQDEERSGNQTRDINRRVGLAEYWMDYGDKHWSASA